MCLDQHQVYFLKSFPNPFLFQVQIKTSIYIEYFIQIKLKHSNYTWTLFRNEKGNGFEPSTPLRNCLGMSFLTRLVKKIPFLLKTSKPIKSNPFHNKLNEKGDSLEPSITLLDCLDTSSLTRPSEQSSSNKISQYIKPIFSRPCAIENLFKKNIFQSLLTHIQSNA